MLSEQKIRQLLKDDSLSDKEALEIRDGFRNLAEVIFEKWQQDKKQKINTQAIK